MKRGSSLSDRVSLIPCLLVVAYVVQQAVLWSLVSTVSVYARVHVDALTDGLVLELTRKAMVGEVWVPYGSFFFFSWFILPSIQIGKGLDHNKVAYEEGGLNQAAPNEQDYNKYLDHIGALVV